MVFCGHFNTSAAEKESFQRAYFLIVAMIYQYITCQRSSSSTLQEVVKFYV